MASSENVLRVFVAAPGDIADERDAVQEVVSDWNTHRGRADGTRLEMVWWGNSARPEMGNRPQALINKQVLDDADMVVAIFWSRFGSPTGVADSGTEEELRRGISAGKPVMIYFCERDIPQANLDAEQFMKIQAFKREMASQGLFWTYASNDEFKSQFARHLADTLEDLLNNGSCNVPASELGGEREAHLDEMKVPGMGSTFVAPLQAADIPMPTVRGQITDRDRVRFIRDAFAAIRTYFRQGLNQLQGRSGGLEYDMDEVNATQFACHIYVRGSQTAQCKVWQSDSMGSPSIHYATDDIMSTAGNSYNEWISVADADLRLVAHMALFSTPEMNTNCMTPEEAARYLWLKFTEYLAL